MPTQTSRALLMELWGNLIEGQVPPERQFNLWLHIHNHNAELIAWGIQELALKLSRKQMDDAYKVKFVSSIMNAKARLHQPKRTATESKHGWWL